MRNCIQIAVALGVVLCTPSAARCQATEYRLGSLTLWKPLPRDLTASYSCSSRDEFANTRHCVIKKSPAAQTSSISEILTDSSTGEILYAYRKYYESDAVDRVGNRAISEISNTLGGLVPKRFTIDNALVAVWGGVKLEKISPGTEEYNEIKGPMEHRYGLLVDTAGSFNATKDNDRPIYRVIGGDGLLVIVSNNTPRQVLVQRFIVAGKTLAERNFKSQAHQFLLQDQTALPNDYSRWSEIAYMIRRLALNTTPENANRVVDEVFGSASSQKYRSHVWAFLPTSVITHLRKGKYHAADVFGDKTEFPDIRDKIVAQLKANPAEPFSDFLLYSLGRFDEAARFNQQSPVHVVLTYALGHSKLRDALSVVFQRFAKPGDAQLLRSQISPKSYLDEVDAADSQFRYVGSTSKENNANYIALRRKMDEYEQRSALRYKEKSFEETNADLRQKDFFHGHAYESIAYSNDDYRNDSFTLSQYLSYFNQFPERYDSRPMALTFPEFTSLTDAVLSQFEEVIKDRRSPHFDDAAYLLGWLKYHRGDVTGALAEFEAAIALLRTDDPQSAYSDSLDYARAALHQTSRILRTLPPEAAIVRVRNSKVFSSQPKLWYTALNGLYHSHKHQSVMDGARSALREFDVTIESLPVTTDPERISAAFTKLNLAGERDLEEIVYLYHAAREAKQLEAMLSNVSTRSAASVSAQVKEAVIKYSRTRDVDIEDRSSRSGPRPLHRDLRQSIYLAQRSLELLPSNAAFSKLRQWLHYKRITLLAQFDPVKVAAANAEFQSEFPNSTLLDDTMAEQLFAEAVIMGNMAKATATFNTLRQRYPTANAIDNAYSWMAIGWTCAGQPAEARKLNQEIIRLFPLTRHARYARERLREGKACAELRDLYLWEYHAMLWRERNRIDVIQGALEEPQR